MLTLVGESHLHATSAVTSVTAAAATAILTAAGAYMLLYINQLLCNCYGVGTAYLAALFVL
jgi:hypothetical protein